VRPAPFVDQDRRTQHGFLPPLPALEQLVPRLVAIAVLAVAFTILTVAVALGVLSTPDHDVLRFLSTEWQESLHPLFQVIAVLGGVEVTTVVMIVLVVVIARHGDAADAWVFIALVATQVFEILYKSNLVHPSPPATVAHADGPSLSTVLSTGAGFAHNSFPSGHMARTVLVYGMAAFVIRRLAPWPWLRALAIPIAVMLIVVMAFDRLYLEVHWESDVVGGLLLGAIALVSATVWLDRPRRTQN
jgi:membrane-associated phospholipid phosphatase